MNNPLFQTDVFENIVQRDLFIDIMDRSIFNEARRYHCITKCSRRRLFQAHTYAFEDVKRVLHNGMPSKTETLDHFKIGAYVGFWIRRMAPINEITFARSLETRSRFSKGDFRHVKPQQEFFALYGNEIAAFSIAYDLAYYGAISRAKKASSVSDMMGKVEEAGLYPSKRTVKEIVVTLKHKHNSPHTLYNTLIALFDGLEGARDESLPIGI